MSYRILTDSCCDLPQELYQKLNLSYVPLTLTYRGKAQEDFTSDRQKAQLYEGLRRGEVATTAAVNPEGWMMAMVPLLEEGEDLLVLAFSSGLSTTFQSAEIAAKELAAEYPERTIRVVDTLCASLGQGLLVYYACQKQKEGLSLEENAAWCEDNKLHLCHWFTVEDLMYLKRGGRISAATAILGTMLNIKPILHVDDLGHLVNVGKVRGRKASIRAMAEKPGELGIPGANDVMFICHGDCLEDAKYLESLVKELYGVKTVLIGYTGAVIGSHSGPGTLALFFLGTHR